jgi:hypothetical protein
MIFRYKKINNKTGRIKKGRQENQKHTAEIMPGITLEELIKDIRPRVINTTEETNGRRN